MSTQFIPKVGMRFELLETEYEVAAIRGESIRSSAVIGGRVYKLDANRFNQLYKSKKLKLLNDELIEKNENTIKPDELSISESEVMNYRLKYVRHVIDKTIYLGSKFHLDPLIKEAAAKHNHIKHPSYSTLRRWLCRYISSSRNPMSLVPRNKEKGNRTIRFDPGIERIINEKIDKYYLNEQKPTCSSIHSRIHDAIVNEFADGNLSAEITRIPSLSCIQRRINQIDTYEKVKFREGKYVAAKLYKAAGKSISLNRALEVVEADGNYLDVLIIDEETGEILGRPYGTCLIDVYTRCVISFFITLMPFSSATLLEALKMAVSSTYNQFGGVIENLIVDNGSDYKSISIKNTCSFLGTNLHFGAPRDPNSKPHVERFFRTLNTQLIHHIPGTTFSNFVMKGDYKSEKYAHITVGKLNEFVSQWLDTVYHKTVHGGTKRAPEKLWNESIKNYPIYSYPLNHLEKISRIVVTRHISRGRVNFENLQWYSHALATKEQELKAQGKSTKVNVYVNSYDLVKVFVEDINDKTISIQADSIKPEYTKGLSLDEHMKIQGLLKKKGKEDINSLSEHELQIARCKLWEDIVAYGGPFAKKQTARLKEANKKKQFKKALDKKQISDCCDGEEDSLENLARKINLEVSSQKINTNKKPDSDSEEFRRI